MVGILLLSLATGILAQEYAGSWEYNNLFEQWEFKNDEGLQLTSKWNSLFKQWDVKDSRGNSVGILEWNSLFERYDLKLYPKPSTPSYTPSTPSYTPSHPMQGVGPTAQILSNLMSVGMAGYMAGVEQRRLEGRAGGAGRRQNPTMASNRKPKSYNRYRASSPEEKNAIRLYEEWQRKQWLKRLGIFAGVVTGGTILVLVLNAYVI